METNTLQLHLHYYFDDKDRHSLDAFIRNENEKDLLLVLKKTCELFGVSGTIIEIVPPVEGGLKDKYQILIKKAFKHSQVLLIAFTAYWTYKGAVSQIEVNDLDIQLKKIELKEKLKQIEEDSLSKIVEKKLTNEILQVAVDTLSKDYKARLHRSNFYSRTHKVTTIITKVSAQALDEKENPLEKEKIVQRTNFKDFVLKNDSIAPIIDDSAVIRIIAPVVDGGNYKWKGWYNDNEIDFAMSDLKFRQDIQLGKVEFTGGSTIECVLQVKRKIDESTGEVRNGAKNVLRVKAHILNDVRTEFTHKKKLKHELSPNSTDQLKLL